MLVPSLPLTHPLQRAVPVDIVDDTYIHVAPEEVCSLVADPHNHARWWPDLRLRTVRDRGVKGQRWEIEGAIAGTMEIWLEPFRDGVIVHHYVRGQGLGRRRRRAGTRHTLRWKRDVTRLKDVLEGRAR